MWEFLCANTKGSTGRGSICRKSWSVRVSKAATVAVQRRRMVPSVK